MDEKQVAQHWDGNAEAWTRLSRAGYDIHRDYVNTPAFLAMLPAIDGLQGLDIGCGEGHNTRLLARRGARMTALDIAGTFVRAARGHEQTDPLGIRYVRASGTRLPFADNTFDFLAGFMSFMDMPGHERLVAESRRVLRPGGFLQFSISHPCFATPKWEWLQDADGRRIALLCGDYFRELNGEPERWMFSSAPAESTREFPLFSIPRFNRTLSGWLNLLMDNGFALERFAEPSVGDEALRDQPRLYDARIIAYFLIVRCRKPAESTEWAR